MRTPGPYGPGTPPSPISTSLLRGTEGSNPSHSSGESSANLGMVGLLALAHDRACEAELATARIIRSRLRPTGMGVASASMLLLLRDRGPGTRSQAPSSP